VSSNDINQLLSFVRILAVGMRVGGNGEDDRFTLCGFLQLPRGDLCSTTTVTEHVGDIEPVRSLADSLHLCRKALSKEQPFAVRLEQLLNFEISCGQTKVPPFLVFVKHCQGLVIRSLYDRRGAVAGLCSA
jgi:hypothetical protein